MGNEAICVSLCVSTLFLPALFLLLFYSQEEKIKKQVKCV